MSSYPQPYTEVETDQSGRHPVSIGHLVMGVAFLGLATIWLLFETDVVMTESLRWFLPLPWLAAGVAGLLAVVLGGRRSKGGPLWNEPDATHVEDAVDDQPL